jgi:excisionase family DNA binding protein
MENQFETMFAELQKLTIALNKNVLTVGELALLSGLTKGYIYNLVHYKKIPHYKSEGGKLVYFKKSEVEKWLCAKYVPTQAETEAKAVAYCVTANRKGGAKCY